MPWPGFLSRFKTTGAFHRSPASQRLLGAAKASSPLEIFDATVEALTDAGADFLPPKGTRIFLAGFPSQKFQEMQS